MGLYVRILTYMYDMYVYFFANLVVILVEKFRDCEDLQRSSDLI